MQYRTKFIEKFETKIVFAAQMYLKCLFNLINFFNPKFFNTENFKNAMNSSFKFAYLVYKKLSPELSELSEKNLFDEFSCFKRKSVFQKLKILKQLNLFLCQNESKPKRPPDRQQCENSCHLLL